MSLFLCLSNKYIIFRFNLDPAWSETGDRYMLKLFRDYLFHQVTQEGRPWLDMSHIVQTLNKFDSGSSDTVNYNYYCIICFICLFQNYYILF